MFYFQTLLLLLSCFSRTLMLSFRGADVENERHHQGEAGENSEEKKAL